MCVVWIVTPVVCRPQACCRRLYNWLKVAPYRPDQQVEEDDDLMDESQGKGIRVLGVAFSDSRCVCVFVWLSSTSEQSSAKLNSVVVLP